MNCFSIQGLVTFALMVTPVSALGETLTIPDATNYFGGSYLSYLAPWGKGSLVYGTDYTESLTLDPSTYPNNQFITWSWPSTPAPKGVYAFLQSTFGNLIGTQVKIPIPSKKIRDIDRFKLTHDLGYGGDREGYDVIYDLFLTRRASDFETISCEIGIFLHTPRYSIVYANRGEVIGKASISGISWTVFRDRNAPHGPFYMFIPTSGADVQSKTIDMRRVFGFLTDKGVISNTLYFNGVGLGAEVNHGSGSLSINAQSAEYR